MSENPSLFLSPGPHIRQGMTTQQIMWWVNASLIPVFAWAVYLYGGRVIGLMISGVIGAVLGEGLVCFLRHQRQTFSDGSAVLTGLLLTATVSPGLALWMPAVGSFAGIVFAKMLFGGLGFNVFNPALIGRAVLMATFPLAMTASWLKPFEAVTQATPLSLFKLEKIISVDTTHLFWGLRSGSIGESSVFLILAGAAVLLSKKIISLYIPLSVIAGLFLVSLFSEAPFFHLLSGGLFLGAFYMATDSVTAPVWPAAQIVFGLLIGILTGVIRIWGGYPEGICYAILILNTVVPALNHGFKPKRPSAEGVLS